MSYFAQTLIKPDTFDQFLQNDSDFNNHAGGTEAIKDARGYFGYIHTDHNTIPPDGNEKNLVIDNRVVQQWTENNGDRDLAIVREKPMMPGKFDIVDAHHGFPTARAIGVPIMPAVILDDNAPYLKDSYKMLKMGQIQPVYIRGGIPLEQQVKQAQVVPGEQGITPDRTKDLAPEYAGTGKAKVQKEVDKANKNKPDFDGMFQALAKKLGVPFESRVKNPDTAIKKIVQHRMEGTDKYDIKGVNDMYGGRFICSTPVQKNQIIRALNMMASEGKFKIEKQQQVSKDTYKAFHIDIVKNGVRGEIQIHDPHSLLEAVTNHDIRAQMGEKPPPAMQQEKQLNAQAAQQMPPQAAMALSQGIEKARQKNG